MHTSNINISVTLDNNKVPQQINWDAADSTADMQQQAKAMMLAFWDGADKSALRIDLWTKDMMVDEMADFFYQTFMGMADSYNRATHLSLIKFLSCRRKYRCNSRTYADP